MSKISTSLRLLEQRGYIKRHRNSAKGHIAYISFTNDGVFIAKTGLELQNQMKKMTLKVLMILKKVLKDRIQIVMNNGIRTKRYNYLFSIKCSN